MPTSRGVEYLRKNFDEGAIVAALAAIALSEDAPSLSDEDAAVVAALRRSSNALEDSSLPELQIYLRSLDEKQVPGVVSNVKGILHEMEFVRVENDDGDSVYASYFDATNHPDTDIRFIDKSTGETWEAQLKATDNPSYVSEWVDGHPDGEILITDELADRLDLPTSGQSNDELTARVEDFVDRLVLTDDSADIWDNVPVLGSASAAVVVWELWQRYQSGAIDWSAFKRLAAWATGLKFAKIGLIAIMLSIPVAGQVTGAILVAKLLLSAKATWFQERATA